MIAGESKSIPDDKNRFSGFSEALEIILPGGPGRKSPDHLKTKTFRRGTDPQVQETAIKKFDDKIKKTEEMVSAIYENYPFISQVISSLDAASKRLSWQEIERHLRDTSSADAKHIVAFHPDEASVELDIGKKVKIFVHESVEQNPGSIRCHKKIQKEKRGGPCSDEEHQAKEKDNPARYRPDEKTLVPPFRWFVTSDGTVVLGGRDASQNEELVKKYMAGGDLFVHADIHGASVVIVKGRTEKMDEVAQFAASYSGAWRSGHFSADVYSAQPGQVSKTPQAGEFVARGSFIVRGERTYYRNIPLAVGIGLVLEPQAAVIGGPPGVVRSRTKRFAELKPGQYQPNDVAKKVLRLLRQKITPDEEKLLKGVLNTETVAALYRPAVPISSRHYESGVW